ncbi:hypothetical protein FHP29_14450 [Nocardioides albidus]|uniref:Uncharacterized protein n=1 Tax=Nocardioides albidus TaxID=1517589 RepID=A0A5C4VRH8_9ACTN|nr:hypothetical protein [Nocardioides albidus]TNM38448.1 hypothetical protein FHP29_14450 [Nocardioides albidus]
MSKPVLQIELWNEADPQLEERDKAAIAAFAADLQYVPPIVDEKVVTHGSWTGRLPVWPFDRTAPEGLDALVPDGALVSLHYPSAYPMVPPRVYVLDPEPTIQQYTQHAWHVAPGGSLCLLQTENDWTPETTPVDLLLKACGWRIEFALMESGLIESMTTNGIVNDPSRDHLLTEAASL